ncbi:PucR family transcriptional regulator ligand-binding domain-containing protein [Microbacterium schleiferi]|nr:PucR family transcriptional regulator ligand-binding domain-containing protein [Microbacterium schleiferi]
MADLEHAMKLEEMLRQERLGLSVVVAAPDALHRDVTGAYITDLPDPSRFLSVGDMVLTSGMWHNRPDAADTFVAALARQRVAALIVGLVHLGHLSDDIIDACRRYGLTLLTISDQVSFKEVAETVTAAQAGTADGLAAKGIRFNSRLAEIVARGEGAEAVLRDFRMEFAIDCWLVDEIGTLVAVAGDVPSTEDVGRVWNLVLGNDSAGPIPVPAMGAGAPRTAWSVTASSQQVVGYFICEGDHRRLSRDTPIVIDGVRGALRLDLEFSSRWRGANHSHVSELVRVLAEDSVSPGEISARMRLEGLDPKDPTVAVIAEVADRVFPPAAVLEMSYRLFARENTHIIGCVIDNRAVLLLNGPGIDGFSPTSTPRGRSSSPSSGDASSASASRMPARASADYRRRSSVPPSGSETCRMRVLSRSPRPVKSARTAR